MVRLLEQDLRRHVAERSKGLTAGFTGAESLTETKVNQLNLRVIGLVNHQNVLWLQVSMSDTEGVEVVNGGGDLMGNLSGSLLGDLEVLQLQVSEEVTSFQVDRYSMTM